jgi:hypothetical protein
VKNDIFLQNFIILKGAISGIEEVNPPDDHHLKERLPEGAKVRSVAEAPRRDGD